MIIPTVGRVVLYRAGDGDGPTLHGDQPCAATVAYVWSPRLVNLAVFDHNGAHVSRTSIVLIQEGDEVPTQGPYCEWMPYQKGQAAKAEALEAKLAAASDANHPPAHHPV